MANTFVPNFFLDLKTFWKHLEKADNVYTQTFASKISLSIYVNTKDYSLPQLVLCMHLRRFDSITVPTQSIHTREARSAHTFSLFFYLQLNSTVFERVLHVWTPVQRWQKKGNVNTSCHTLTLFIERANNVLFSGFQLRKHLLSGHPFDHSLIQWLMFSFFSDEI